ncbi:MAG TPA: hypothetical protein OIM43_12960 [Prevotellaceae bacterium]|nr:hypothetical protein [Prevotellaceae bacterium]
MKSICYLVPYFGRLPKNFGLWLISCKANPTINWIIYTDDHTKYDYPQNIKVIYTTYDKIKNKIQSFYDFDISFERPWRLALMKSAYGEIFQDDIKDYDFWGYCDVDLMWGNIRKFYTEELLNRYNRIGFQGHSTLMRNTDENNKIYRTIVPNKINYIDVFSGKSNMSFDENGMDTIFRYLSKEYYHQINFANLLKYNTGFYLYAMPKEDAINNKYQIFTWKNGTLLRHYLDENDKIVNQEFCYIHFWCRPMKFAVKELNVNTTYYIYPDVMTDKNIGISIKSLKKYGNRTRIGFLLNMIWVNRHKITISRILFNLKAMINK